MFPELYIPAPFWLIAAATGIELWFGWPAAIPHPVRLVGRLYTMLEPLARRSRAPRMAGWLALLTVVLMCAFLCVVLLSPVFFHKVIALALAVSGLALGELVRACAHALDALDALDALEACAQVGESADGGQAGRLAQARLQVGLLVSRDTTNLEAPELRRALAETVSENFNDAFVAPLFWLTLTGPVGLWIYKGVSTGDSMWGYMTPKWKDIGRASAITDDLLAWVPARLSAFLLWLTAGKQRSRWPGWKTVARQARTMDSPNAGWPMAAAAWLHNGLMGGPTAYFGEVKHKPRLGPWDREPYADQTRAVWTTPSLRALITHVRRAGLAGVAVAGLFLGLLALSGG